MGGCWTCRVRKKRCGQQAPSCDECDRLGLECDGYGARPVWADGAQLEQDYKMSLKEEIKQRQRFRRKQSLPERPDTPPQTYDAQAEEIETTDDSEEYLNTPFVFPLETPYTEIPPALPLLPIEAFSSTGVSLYNLVGQAMPHNIQEAYFSVTADGSFDVQETELDKTADLWAQTSGAEEYRLLLYYLDSGFWRQHPRLEQTTAVPDRSWILVLFHSSQVFKEALLHVSRCLYTQRDDKVLQDAGIGESTNIQSVIRTIHNLANDLIFEEGNLLLTSTVSLLAATGLTAYYGVLTRNRDYVHSSLTISRTLLEYIKQSEETFRVCLHPSSVGSETDQILASALQTSYAQLLWLDTMEAATISSSCLLEIHLPIDTFRIETDIECIFGCQSWILHALRQVVGLREWKKACLMDGRLSMFELNRRSTELLEQITQNQMSILMKQSPSTGAVADNELWTSFQNSTASQIKSVSSVCWEEDVDVITRIHAQAVTIYLQVIVLGANSGLLEIQSAIATALELLGQLRSIDSLACMQWPLMILSCLSTQSQRQRCKSILDKAVHRPKLKRTCSNILDMAQKFWRLTGEVPTMTWDWESIIDQIDGYSRNSKNSLSI